jgi:hypothetical protein
VFETEEKEWRRHHHHNFMSSFFKVKEREREVFGDNFMYFWQKKKEMRRRF